MANNLTTACEMVNRTHRDHIMTFIRIVRQQLKTAGIEDDVAIKLLKDAVREYKKKQNFNDDCSRSLQSLSPLRDGREYRGTDNLGRLIVEYCFIRNNDSATLYPEDSHEEEQARKLYCEQVIPRPLMRYFLISVRGTLPHLNRFKAHSVLFGQENQAHAQRKHQVEAILEEHILNTNGTFTVNWPAVYEDDRLKNIALGFIAEIRREIELFGLERYLKVLENLRRRDPDRTGVNHMKRPFELRDVKQISEALWLAEVRLSQG